MRITNLTLNNIGPFRDANLNFKNDNGQVRPVSIITGENGSGKSIILDAIRTLFYGPYHRIGRNIISNRDKFLISANIRAGNKEFDLRTLESRNDAIQTNNPNFNVLFYEDAYRTEIVDWVCTYWNSTISNDPFNIAGIVAPHPEQYLVNSLSGMEKNVEVVQLITYFDYLRTSDDTHERDLGIFIFDVLRKIIKLSLSNGELKFVSRKALDPIITQNGFDVSLNNLSSGNLFFIQRMVSLLGKMYSVAVLNGKPYNEVLNTKGLILIDEAENHLHPKWQKTFLDNIFSIFPNVQIILTTHSPFIIASYPDANIFVCESKVDHCIVNNLTEEYSNRPVDEILLTPVFRTQPFNTQISNLILDRKDAIQKGDRPKRLEIEEKLKELNPEYFSFLNVND